MENHGGVAAGVTTELTDGLTTFGMNVSGATLMVTPLALWVAWTETVRFIVLAAGVMAGALYCLLACCEKPDDLSRGASAAGGPAATVPDRFVAELHGLMPLTYHRWRLGDLRFRRKMDRLKRLLRRWRPESQKSVTKSRRTGYMPSECLKNESWYAYGTTA